MWPGTLCKILGTKFVKHFEKGCIRAPYLNTLTGCRALPTSTSLVNIYITRQHLHHSYMPTYIDLRIRINATWKPTVHACSIAARSRSPNTPRASTQRVIARENLSPRDPGESVIQAGHVTFLNQRFGRGGGEEENMRDYVVPDTRQWTGPRAINGDDAERRSPSPPSDVGARGEVSLSLPHAFSSHFPSSRTLSLSPSLLLGSLRKRARDLLRAPHSTSVPII